MSKLVIICSVLFLGMSSIQADSIWQKESYSFYSSKRTPKIGDVVTILISAESTAVSQAGTKTSKKAGIGANLYGIQDRYSGTSGSNSDRGLYNYSLEAKDDYSGLGQTTRKSKVETVISATITDILENGNLLIVGEYSISINDETEKIRISGVVRPGDIGPDNTIASHKIANGQVSVKGEGVVSSKQTPGVLSKLFNWVF